MVDLSHKNMSCVERAQWKSKAVISVVASSVT